MAAATPILLAEGDAVIALQNVPHSSSQNLGPDPRMNIYFRLRVDRPGAELLADEDKEAFGRLTSDLSRETSGASLTHWSQRRGRG